MILREAGARITDRHGQALVYNRSDAVQPSMVAAGERLHGEILVQIA